MIKRIGRCPGQCIPPCEHCTDKPVNPRAGEVCSKCGNHMFVLQQYCEWDGQTCQARISR